MTDHWSAETADAGAERPVVPFQQFIVKLHSRCNLACDYCYMYQAGDTSWRYRPKLMSHAVIRQTCLRIGEHVRRHALSRIEVVLHGGEPLLAGATVLGDIATELREAVPLATRVDLVVQTNGTLLDETVLDVLLAHGIQVGVSVDGTQGSHDRHRRYADGRGSHARIRQSLRLLGAPRYRRLFTGLLCVIDPDEDPIATYESLLACAPPRVDFLLPHGNWSVPPPHRPPGTRDVPYGRWLTTVFDRWYGVPSQETEVRLFTEIINLAFGGQSRTESVGLSPVAVITVNTDGSLEQVDNLRTAYRGNPGTGLNVTTNSFDDALRHPAVVDRQLGLTVLGKPCQQCDIRRICGGGHYAHRYRRGSGFHNPSVYCPDLTSLITHILRRLQADLS